MQLKIKHFHQINCLINLLYVTGTKIFSHVLMIFVRLANERKNPVKVPIIKWNLTTASAAAVTLAPYQRRWRRSKLRALKTMLLSKLD
jgi:hypothetical protein